MGRPESGKEVSPDELSCLGKVKRAVSLMTIEPALLIHMTASFMGNLMATDLLQFQACTVNLGYNETYCRSSARRNPGVQDLVAEINIYKQVIDYAFPVIYVLFLGAWSDIYGRKFPILMTMTGYIIRYMGLLVAVYFPNTNAYTVAIISSLPVSLTGGRTAVSFALYSYVADTTSIRDRTFRMGVITAIRTFGKSAGSALGGILKGQGFDYTFIFGVGGGMDVLAFAYTIFFVRNTRKDNPARKKDRAEIVKEIFNVRHVVEAFKCFLKKRENRGTLKLILLIIILICTMAPMQGEESVLQLFATSDQIGWDTANYGYYGTYRMLIAFIGGILSLIIFVETCKLDDSILGVLSCFSQIGGSLIYGFADGDLMMYLAPAVDILNGSMIIAARSMISKVVPYSEMGKVNSLVGIFDTLTPLAGNPIYSAIYKATLSTVPGTFFFVSVALTIPPLFIFSWFKCNPIIPPDQGQIKTLEESDPETLSNSSSPSSSSSGHHQETPANH